MEHSIILCKNCGTQLSEQDAYCSNCGQKIIKERYTVKRFWGELIRIITNVERGFWFTLKQMFVAPATVISNYLNGKTKPYYHPFRYIFIWASIAVVIGLYFHFYDNSQDNFNDLLGINQSD
jgi:DNA-directed RNA polymerase subunit RPC12/RpoP